MARRSPGGTAGAFVLDYARGMQMLLYFFDAAVAPRYLMTLEPAAQQKLAVRLREMIPTAAHGSIARTAKAWTVKGRA